MVSDPVDHLKAAEHALRVEGAIRLADIGLADPKALEPLDHPGIALEDGAPELDLDDEQTVRPERILAIAPEHGIAVTTIVSKGGDRLVGKRSEYDVRVRALTSDKRRALAIAQRQTVAAGISPNGRAVIVLDEKGGVLCYDLVTSAYPDGARAREPENGKYACIALANGSRVWLASTGGSLEVRVVSDEKPVATVDISAAGDEIRRARFLADGSGFEIVTERGVVMRFELLLDRVGTSREARVAAISDVVDASIAGGRWRRYEPRVEVYEERTEGDRTTFFFVASHYEYHQAQSGSDWAEHYLCAGHATFEGDRCLDVQLTSTEPRQITERDDETYDVAAEIAAFRTAAAGARSSE